MQVDVSTDGTPKEDERIGDGIVQSNGSSIKHELIDVYSPLPEDLLAALVQLTPVDDTSSANLAAWLSRNATALHSFERYASSALFAAGNMPAVGAVEARKHGKVARRTADGSVEPAHQADATEEHRNSHHHSHKK